MEIHQFYKRVDEMTEASVGPPPWLLDNEKGGTIICVTRTPDPTREQ
jgi:hypothetical protein